MKLLNGIYTIGIGTDGQNFFPAVEGKNILETVEFYDINKKAYSAIEINTAGITYHALSGEQITAYRSGGGYEYDFNRASEPITSGIITERWANAVKEVAALYGLTVCDLYNDCEIQYSSADREAYMNDPEPPANTLYSLHPNTAGYAVMSNKIIETFNKFSNLSGKSVVTFGDSITWYDGNAYNWGKEVGQVAKGYQSYMQERLGLVTYNEGESGITMLRVAQKIRSYNNFKNVNYMTIMSGANDERRNTPVGTLAPKGSNFNTQTYIGALQSGIEYALSQNPNITIVLFTPIVGWIYTGGTGRWGNNEGLRDVVFFNQGVSDNLNNWITSNGILASSRILDGEYEFNEILDVPEDGKFSCDCSFSNQDQKYNHINPYRYIGGSPTLGTWDDTYMYYDDLQVYDNTWTSDSYRRVVFNKALFLEEQKIVFYEWFIQNAQKINQLYKIESSTLQDIATAIRTKRNITNQIFVKDFSEEILNIRLAEAEDKLV
jgi:lysophospholipase L1-like esterase